MRLRLIRFGYKLAWLGLRLLALFHHGRGRGAKAILTSGDRVLLVEHTYGPKRWELPGGGVRRHETAADGIRREIREELGVDVPQATLVAVGHGSRRERNRTLSYFTAEIEPTAVRPDQREIARAEWFAPTALPAPLGWSVLRAVRAWRQGISAPVDLDSAH